jgi:hypothetical protein
MTLDTCLGRTIFRIAKKRKTAEAPKLLLQLITALPIAANGLVNAMTSGHRSSPLGRLRLSSFGAMSGDPANDDLQAFP